MDRLGMNATTYMQSSIHHPTQKIKISGVLNTPNFELPALPPAGEKVALATPFNGASVALNVRGYMVRAMFCEDEKRHRGYCPVASTSYTR